MSVFKTTLKSDLGKSIYIVDRNWWRLVKKIRWLVEPQKF